MNKIENKQTFFELWSNGLLGNKLRSWGTPEDIKDDNYGGFLTMRMRDKSGGGKTIYNIPAARAKIEYDKWLSEGIKPIHIYFNESAPDEFLISQGEIMRSNDFYDYFYCNEKMKMKDAMRLGKTMKGLQVKLYLESIMTPNSWTDLQELLDKYPGSVIEFSVYEHCLGCYPGRNCLIWEIRSTY